MNGAVKSFNVKVYRTDPADPSKSWYDTFTVPYERGASVLDVLKYIYDNLDHSLAFTNSCRIGKCTCCHDRVNGKTRLSCTTVVDGNDLTVEPLPGYPVIRDLVVDRTKDTIAKRRDKGDVKED